MRKIFLLITSIVFFSTVSAQVTKGNFLAGGSISFQSRQYTDGGDDINMLTLAPNAGYFFADKIAAGLKISFTNYKNDNNSYRDFIAGPFARYYFLPAEKKINVLAEANFMLGSEKYEGFAAESKTAFGFAAGPAFFFNEHVAMETLLGWQSLKHKGDAGRYNSFGLAVGFQVHLNRSKKK